MIPSYLVVFTEYNIQLILNRRLKQIVDTGVKAVLQGDGLSESVINIRKLNLIVHSEIIFHRLLPHLFMVFKKLIILKMLMLKYMKCCWGGPG